MNSSTSPSSYSSNAAVNGASIALLGALILSYILAVIYSIWINPEVRFWKEAYRQKISWARKLTATSHPKLIFIGGSSCAFQIDAGMLTAAGFPSVNMGMHAGMGSRATAAFGLSAVAPDDTVIWAIEKDRLTKPPELDPLGYQTLVATGVIFGSGAERWALQNLDWDEVASSLRPGLDHCAIMLGKVATRYPLYRYKIDHIRPGGAITTDERRGIQVLPFKEKLPDSKTLKWISKMVAELAGISVRSDYLIPQAYVDSNDAQLAYQANTRFLEALAKFVTIEHDPLMGVQTNLNDFADTSAHLTAEAMTKRTKGLIELFRNDSKNTPTPP